MSTDFTSRRTARALVLAAGCIVFGVANAAQAQCTLPHTLTNGQPADSAQVMANFNALVSCLGSVAPGGGTNSVQYNAGAGSLGGVGPLTNGQLVVGSTGNAPQAQALVAGTGVSIANGPGSVVIGTTGGSGGLGLYRQITSALPTSFGTGLVNWFNQGSATVADTAAGITIDGPTTGNNTNILGRYRAAPAPPYTITALIAATRNANNSNEVGLGWYDGGSKLNTISLKTNGGNPPFIIVSRWVSSQADTTPDFVSAFNAFAQPIWFQVRDDGTNVSFAFSQDGATFLTVFSIAKSSGYLGATGYSNLIFYVSPRGGRVLGTLLSWTQS
jgi:hypothetical protein